jgi:hypothetical protein
MYAYDLSDPRLPLVLAPLSLKEQKGYHRGFETAQLQVLDSLAKKTSKSF